MADMESATAQKLLKAFMQFRSTGWHERKIAGYNPSEFKVLAAIYREGHNKKADMKVSEISQKLHVTPPTITQIINTLEKDGLVERKIDPDDRRAVKINLTSNGERAVIEARRAFFESFSGLIDHLGEEDIEKLAELLSKVMDYFNHHLNR
ncbi:MarR family transcriptional regulator [Neobacillus niacini]|uniref:MarR family winged helix-turn-helix transcriptional regulator n=1 Tax=Neobacillus niacini TaxID=86668 RepID=UPI002860AC63|nr:MarR family transcriptional regulator [Neobacillus niacini]MDR7001721.1 DNA-binding MarR family transcriptional regulator [Neobacillus niacini]